VSSDLPEAASHAPSAVASPAARRPAKWRTRRPISPAVWVIFMIVYPVTVLLFRMRYRHLDRIPATGPVLLVANHVSILDPLACGRLVWDAGRFPHFLAKVSVFKGFGGTLLRASGQIPVYRGTADARSSLSAAEADLAAGNLIVIYPEGSVTRDPEWWPMRSQTGVARLALTTDAVVVPVAQWGVQRLHDYHAKKLYPRLRTSAYYYVGEPVDLSQRRAEVRAGRPLTAELLHETTDLIMAQVRTQLGEVRGEQPPSSFYPRPGRALPADVPGNASGSAA
jgi:1-acyl-sn-glycerol-3-phosphate acyltransferase